MFINRSNNIINTINHQINNLDSKNCHHFDNFYKLRFSQTRQIRCHQIDLKSKMNYQKKNRGNQNFQKL